MARTSTNAPGIMATWFGALALLGAAAAEAQTISRGEVIATTCYTCHGTHGISNSSIPSINEFSPEHMISVLQGFRSGQRASTVMGRHATAYTDEEISEVAHYFGNLQKKKGK